MKKINYVITPTGKKLFSFNRHDYKIDEGVFIDGGFDYTRTNSIIYADDIANLIGDIRWQFMWGKNYDKFNNRLEETQYTLLKDLDTNHIVNILIYFTNKLTTEVHLTEGWIVYHLIFLHELKYRHENNLE